MPKSVLMFVAGAILASGLVFLMMRDRTPEPTSVAQLQESPVPQADATVPPPAETSQTPAPASQPEVIPAPEPQRVPARERATPAARAPRNDAAASARPSSAAQPSAPAAPAGTPAPATQPSQPSQPQQPQASGPMIPNEQPRLPGPDQVQPAAPRKPEPRQAKTVTIPAGTLLTVRVDETLRSDKNQSGDSFRATLDQPLVVDGFVIAERGSRVEGRVAEADPGGRVRGVSQMALELVRLTTADGQRVKLTTESFAKQGERSTKKDAAKIGAAAGIGAAIGAIAGGGKGAAIGAGVGGAAGAGGVMATRGEAAEVKAETRLSFRLREPITITEKL